MYMAILLANIGKSDLLIKSEIYEQYWIPLGFDREEPNLREVQATDEEKQIWREREEIIITELYPQLKIEAPPKDDRGKYKTTVTFRQLTEKIWNAYETNERWHDLIRPSGRILGAIETISAKFKLETVYIFITDQTPKEHEGDSCFTFRILKKWLSKEEKFKHLQLEPITITFDPRPQDKTLQFYYESIDNLLKTKKIKESDIVAISIKGGTPQMQVGLQMQSIASGIAKQLFLEPQVDVAKIIKGESSDCKITSYWRYLRSQKYQTVKLLLNNRWDFDGAKVVLEEWREILNFIKQYLPNDDRQSIDAEINKLGGVITQLDRAVNSLNLSVAPSKSEPADKLLNIYTQCRLYWQLNEFANFLTRLGMLYEEVLHSIIRKLDTENYCNKYWNIDKSIVSQEDIEEIRIGLDVHANHSKDRSLWSKNNNLYQLNWIKINRDGINEGINLSMSRYRKKGFAQALITIRQQNREAWKEIDNLLSSLDYWVSKRNNLIHSGEGLSKAQMEALAKSDNACHPDEIVKYTTSICDNTLKIIDRYNKHLYLDINGSDSSPYYIYSKIREQVIKDLINN
jgi:hypothetical protein